MSQQSSPPAVLSPSTPSSSSTVGEPIISHKKPLRIRSQQSERRRSALKEYYQLQQKLQEKQKQKENASLLGHTGEDVAEEEDEDDLEREISENRPIAEIDLAQAEFKEVLVQTNRLSTSINLINSSIKNIIYNNYYELIKLNDFLNDLNELNLAKLVEAEKKNDKKDVLDFLKKTDTQNDNGNASATDNTTTPTAAQGLDGLRKMMKKIETLDKADFTKEKIVVDEGTEKAVTGITTLLVLQDKIDAELEEEYKSALNTKITQWVTDLKKQDGKQGLIRQLEDVKRGLQPSVTQS